MKTRILYVGDIVSDEVSQKTEEMIRILFSLEKDRENLIKSIIKTMSDFYKRWEIEGDERSLIRYHRYLDLFEESNVNLEDSSGNWDLFCDKFCFIVKTFDDNLVGVYSFGGKRSEG